MATLYIRHRNSIYINFINSKDDLLSFHDNLIPGRHLVIGDLATFTPTMMNMLLKLIEENPNEIDCYTSADLTDPVLLSRFAQVIKEPLFIMPGSNADNWAEAKHDYVNAEQFMGSYPTDVKLRLPLVSRSVEKLLSLI